MMFFSEYSIEWQHVLVLLYAVNNISGGSPSRQNTIEYIQKEGLLSLREEDYLPYPSQREPSWCTDVAWARKNAVMLGYLHNLEWNSWDISRDGREFLDETLKKGSLDELWVGRCFLWSPRMKRKFCSTYTPSQKDAVAPPKGQRSVPDIRELQEAIKSLMGLISLTQLAMGFSKKLGVSIPATVPSIAFAWWTIKQEGKNVD